jgi:hypothetical protein
MPELAPRFSKGREAGLIEIAAVLRMEASTLKAIADSPGFPGKIGMRFGQRIWRMSDVADYFDRIGWPADAEALRRWPK